MHLNPATLIGTHKYRIDLLRTERVLMFVDLHYGTTEYCVRALVNGNIAFSREYYMEWFKDYSLAYKAFDNINTGKASLFTEQEEQLEAGLLIDAILKQNEAQP